MDVREFFKKYHVNLYEKRWEPCDDCALKGVKCGTWFDGCPLPGRYNFKEIEK